MSNYEYEVWWALHTATGEGETRTSAYCDLYGHDYRIDVLDYGTPVCTLCGYVRQEEADNRPPRIKRKAGSPPPRYLYCSIKGSI